MSEMSARRLVSGRSMKLVAGGVSLLALALLAVLTAGLLTNEPSQDSSTHPASNGVVSSSPGPDDEPALPSGSRALHAAVDKNDHALVRILVEGGADVNAKDVFGDSPLHKAIDKDHGGMVSLLVELGADVNAKNAFGDPALHRAIFKGDVEIVRILVEAGADADLRNAFGDSALERAVSVGNEEILRILLDMDGG